MDYRVCFLTKKKNPLEHEVNGLLANGASNLLSFKRLHVLKSWHCVRSLVMVMHTSCFDHVDGGPSNVRALLSILDTIFF